MASKKGSKPEAEKAASSHNGGEVNHTPIIIDEGSLSIEFAEAQHYFRVGSTNVHRANDLALESVMVNMKHTQGEAAGSVFCRVFAESDDAVIEVVEQGNKGFRIHKFSNGHTTEIEFDHNVYKPDPQFKPHGNGHRFRNANRKIVGLRIAVNGALKHDCEFASTSGVFYTISDPHA